MISIPKGTKDMLPSEAYKWHFIEECARETARLFNIKEIRTPIFEHTELFLRGVGGTTDIVNKEMYTFNDKGGRSITLKPEGTAGVARAFIENGIGSEALPVKLYYLTPVFRYERPQAGRLRQHHQFGIEFFGAEKPSADCEIILVAKTFFEKAGIGNLRLNINSIGCKSCRPKYNEAVRQYAQKNADALCAVCNERVNTNPLRVLDCKQPECKAALEGAPKTTDYICAECGSHFEQLQKYLDACKVSYGINHKIVRGLDYYTKTVFEFISDGIGAQGTVCGGGRYDNLIEELCGKSVAGAGFGMGLERLLLLLDQKNITQPKPCDVYIAPVSEQNTAFCLKIADDLRRGGVSAETDLKGRSLKAQYKYADKLSARYVIAIGDDEMQKNSANIKNMQSGEEKNIEFSNLFSYIKER